MSYLSNVLSASGVTLTTEEEAPNVLTQEQQLVIRDIGCHLNQDQVEENVKKFLTELKLFFNNQTALRLALRPTVLRKDDAEEVSSESVFRILLHVDELQTAMVDILLEEVARLASESDEDSIGFVRLYLNCLRYLPYIKNVERIAEKILDILEISTFEAQLELLNLIPIIISESQCDNTAKALCRLLRDVSELTPAVLDCLQCLNLSSDSKDEVENCLMDKLNDFSRIQDFAVLYECLTKNCSSSSINNILGKCRDALGEILLVEEEESQSQKVIILIKVSTSIYVTHIYEGYLNFLSKVKKGKGIDILLFIFLHSASQNKKGIVEKLFKKQVKNDVVNMSNLENFYEKYLNKHLLENYLNSLSDLAACLLKDHNTIEFSTIFYKLTFNNKNINNIQRQDIIDNLLTLVPVWNVKDVSHILNVLIVLSENTDVIQQYTNQLTLLLDKLHVYELADVKSVFDILCSLVCKDENYSGIKNELHILIRKELSVSNVSVCRGIIGALSMIKHILITPGNESDLFTEDSSIIVDDLSEHVQECIKIFNHVEIACEKSSDLIRLFYDQLSHIILNVKLDECFLKWLHDKVTSNFQDKYVIESLPSPMDNVHFSTMYSLNTADEMDSEIYINIAGLTVKKNTISPIYSIDILASIFRLLRLLHFKENNGDLTTIDALLGCGVILPKIDNIEEYSMDELKLIADCFYHCVNWFRELISAYAPQSRKKIRQKVLQRLQNLLEVEQNLDEVMKLIPEHTLPTVCFYREENFSATSNKINIKRPKKKPKLDETALSMASAKTSASKKTKKNQTKIDYNFRELDTDIMILLKYPLKLGNGDLEQMSQQTQQTTIDLSSFNFLLKDLAGKLQVLTKNNKSISIVNISIVSPLHIITDCLRLLPNIYNKYQVIRKRIKSILEEIEFVYDHHNLFTPQTNELKTTFCAVLRCLDYIFNWNGFKNPKNLKLLKDCLKCLRSTVESSQLQSSTQLSKDFSFELSGYTEQCLNLTSGVSLIKILQGLYVINACNVDIKKKISSTSSKLLSRPWFDDRGNLETGKEHLFQIDILVCSYLDGTNVKTLGGLIATLQNQSETLRSKEDNLEMLKSITKTNFHVLYRNFCIYLLQKVKDEIVSLTNNEHLALWKTVAVGMQDLMAILKMHESRSNLIHFLKKSIGILKVFLSHGIPILEIVLKSRTDRVVEILKTFQTSTRFLHHLCCHSKVTKDSALNAHVPRFRMTLETFIFRVKAMLIANGCSAAFWLGNLRNRDLHGEDILSQSSNGTTETGGDDDEEEELPPDDDSDGDTTDFEGANKESSASEVFD